MAETADERLKQIREANADRVRRFRSRTAAKAQLKTGRCQFCGELDFPTSLCTKNGTTYHSKCRIAFAKGFRRGQKEVIVSKEARASVVESPFKTKADLDRWLVSITQILNEKPYKIRGKK